MRYLDPKSDLTFKRVFGRHKHLTISLLNALLPLDDDALIQEIEYLPTELVPEIPLLKNSIVDVRCKDLKGRQFIVEMQLSWTAAFEQRVLFNAAKAYVRQLERKKDYSSLQPVYGLSIVNENAYKTEGFYHHFEMICNEENDLRIEGLQLVFVELSKFSPRNMAEKRMRVLWLRFLKELEGELDEKEIPQELLDNPLTREAVENLRENSYSATELEQYDKYWDAVSYERTLISGKTKEGYEQGIREKSEELSRALAAKKQAEEEKKQALVKAEVYRLHYSMNMKPEDIASVLGISSDEVRTLLN